MQRQLRKKYARFWFFFLGRGADLFHSLSKMMVSNILFKWFGDGETQDRERSQSHQMDISIEVRSIGWSGWQSRWFLMDFIYQREPPKNLESRVIYLFCNTCIWSRKIIIGNMYMSHKPSPPNSTFHFYQIYMKLMANFCIHFIATGKCWSQK